MAEFKVGNKAKRLRHGDVAICFEPSRHVRGFVRKWTVRLSHVQHQRQRSTRLNVAKNKLGQDVEANLVTGDCLDDSDRQCKGEG